MLISKVNTQYNNLRTINKSAQNISFGSLQQDLICLNNNKVRVKKGSLTKDIENKINDIAKNPDMYTPLGIGGTAKVYKYENENGCYAIKLANDEHSVGMSDGITILEKLPDKMQKKGQRLIAFGEIEGREFLVTNLVKGSSKEPAKTKEQLHSLLIDNILELDKAGILHQDLWMPNIMVDGNNVNLIDYDYAKEFSPLTDTDNRQPNDFVLNSNLFDFEVSGLETYINAINTTNPDETREFFINYLQTKSIFHSKRAEFIEQELKRNEKNLTEKEKLRIKKSIQYERLMSQVLEQPSDEIIELEAQRAQMLYSFNWSNKNAYFKKPTDAVQCWMRTIIYARKYEDSIKALSEKINDKTVKDYLKFQNEYAKFYTKTFGEWGKSTINWLFNIFCEKKPLNDYDAEVYNNGIENPISQLHKGFKQYEDMTDIYSTIIK